MVVGIEGPGIQTLLRQVCSVDFVPLFESCGPDEGPVCLTSMVGVGVVAWPRRTESGSTLRVWLDPSFAHYFWTTLLEVGRGVGAMVIGSNT
jgi:sarcosine oxidase gamma subunit